LRPGNAGGAKGPDFWRAFEDGEVEVIGDEPGNTVEEPSLRFTSLAHHITRDRVQKNLSQIPKRAAAGVDGQTVEAAKESFDGWIEPMLQSIHRQGYRAPNIRRVYKPRAEAAAGAPQKSPTEPAGVGRTISAAQATRRSSSESSAALCYRIAVAKASSTTNTKAATTMKPTIRPLPSSGGSAVGGPDSSMVE
jgi:hypothetical protein